MSSGTFVSDGVVLKSNQTLIGAGRGKTIIQLEPNAGAYTLTNSDTVSGNINITVRGVTLDGNRSNQASLFDFGQCVFFQRMTGLTMEDITIKNPVKFGLHVTGSSRVILRDGYFDYPSPTPFQNMDGIHLNACHDVLVENWIGYTGDDFICVASTENGGETAPVAWASGPSYNVTVRNITGVGADSGVRIYDGAGDDPVDPSGKFGVYNVLFDGIHGTFKIRAIMLSASDLNVNTHSITFRNITCDLIDDNARFVSIVTPIKDVLFDDVRLTPSQSGRFLGFGTSTFADASTATGSAETITISNFVFNTTNKNFYAVDLGFVGVISKELNFVTGSQISTTNLTQTNLVIGGGGSSLDACNVINCYGEKTQYVFEFNNVDGAVSLGTIKVIGSSFNANSQNDAVFFKWFGTNQDLGRLEIINSEILGFGASFFTPSTGGIVHDYLEVGSRLTSVSVDYVMPGGLGGSGNTIRFRSQTAKIDYLSKVTPATGDRARTTQIASFTAEPYEYDGSSWHSLSNKANAVNSALTGTTTAQTITATGTITSASGMQATGPSGSPRGFIFYESGANTGVRELGFLQYQTPAFGPVKWATVKAGAFDDSFTVEIPNLTTGTTGNAGTATALATARTINGVSFDGTANITVPGKSVPVTVATLPVSPAAGDWAAVTDALAPTYGATVVGGGAVATPVWYDGTNWTCR
jgi:hypothetical protein